MKRLLEILFDLYGPLALTVLIVCLLGCKTPPSDRPYAHDEVAPVTEQPRTQFYTNHAEDRLIEAQILGPPVLPGRGPFPLWKSPPAVSNWMTPKAMAVQPKALITNQIPGSVILSRITTTGSDGKPFTAILELQGNQTIQANDRMAVVIFSINTTNWTIEQCTNLLDGKWYPMASGTGGNTNHGALVIVDLKEDSSPIKFYRQKPAP